MAGTDDRPDDVWFCCRLISRGGFIKLWMCMFFVFERVYTLLFVWQEFTT